MFMSIVHRPRNIGALVALALGATLVTACGSSGSVKTSPTSSASTSTTSTSVAIPSTTSAPSSTVAPPTTTTPVSATWMAVWPTVASGTRYRDPVVAARSFATSYLRMVAPLVGTFKQGDTRSGEVPVRSSARAPVTTVLVRQLDTDSSWWVLSASTPNIRPTAPAALATITSPVRLRGSSTAFEATVNVSIRADDRSTPLAESYFMGGATGLGPYDASMKYTPSTSRYGAIVLYTISSESGHVAEATVIRVRFAGA